MRAPDRDDPALGKDDLASNHFLFNEPTRPISLLPVAGPSGGNFPDAIADPDGLRCPHIAHIRKVNPRDGGSELGGENDTLTRLVLRRGIPYGPPLLGVENPSEEQLATDRGLLFLCYQTSIVEQFETVTRAWANTTEQPSSGGHDPIIGQTADNNRQRTVTLPQATPAEPILIGQEWVIPTGGGYFFAPSIHALTKVLARSDS
jgi:deferrochelatase/peroxidase EfeB